jgi:predicted transcriptional regulator
VEATTLDFVKARLERLRGQWKRVATESGVPYKTIKNIMQGRTKDPRMSNVERLRDYLRREAA